MPSDEYERLTRDRRPEFLDFLSIVWATCNPELDIYDWGADIRTEPLFVTPNEAQYIENLCIGTEFKMEWGDDSYSEPLSQKIWIYDEEVNYGTAGMSVS
jgi:hypothetical protein